MQKNNSNQPPYLLIADSGSTKTAWCRAFHDGKREVICTRGINPAVQDEKTITTILREDLMPLLSGVEEEGQPQAVHFYGAGCIPSACSRMTGLLSEFLPAATIEVESDLLGSARALCGRETGIACILGTGSNSGLYDGKVITKHVSPLGYILGDEGSGTTLGKRFVSDLLKGLLPDDIRTAFSNRYGLSESDIIQKVYREPGANRFLASLTMFIHEYRMQPAVRSLIVSCFEDFFRRNVDAYGRKDIPVGFTGSIACHFRDELGEAARTCGYRIGKIIPSPIEDITDFHLQESKKSRVE